MIRFLAALGAALFLLFGSVHAQETRLDDIINRGTLRVGTTGDYLPFTSLDKATQTYHGFDIDMAQALVKALDHMGHLFPLILFHHSRRANGEQPNH